VPPSDAAGTRIFDLDTLGRSTYTLPTLRTRSIVRGPSGLLSPVDHAALPSGAALICGFCVFGDMADHHKAHSAGIVMRREAHPLFARVVVSLLPALLVLGVSGAVFSQDYPVLLDIHPLHPRSGGELRDSAPDSANNAAVAGAFIPLLSSTRPPWSWPSSWGP
jgi:hypothetical protein